MSRPTARCDLEFTGTLVDKASARNKMIDSEGHNVPVLCFEVELESDSRQRCRVEQPFPVGHMPQCEAAARRLKAGTRVTFQAPLVGIRLLVPNVAHVHVLQDEAVAA
jgi:hypothetical protein